MLPGRLRSERRRPPIGAAPNIASPLRLWIDGQIFERQGHGGVSRIWAAYLPLLVGAGADVTVSVSERAVSTAFLELVESVGFDTIQSDRRVDPISIFDAHSRRTRWLRGLAPGLGSGVFQSTWDSTVESGSWPEVMMVHDMIAEMTLRPRRSVFHAQVIASRKRALGSASAIVAVSETTARDLATFYPETAAKTHVVRHGPTLTDVAPADVEQLLDGLGPNASPGQFYLFVGRRQGYKNFGVVRELFDVSPGVMPRLIAVGGEAPSPGEEHRAITFIPYVTDAELVALYRSARALIYPSRYEGFGLPVLEAMSQGCPVVSSNADALREVGGDASVYFDPGSVTELTAALAEVDGLDRAAHADRVERNLARFSWADSAGRLMGLYRSLSAST